MQNINPSFACKKEWKMTSINYTCKAEILICYIFDFQYYMDLSDVSIYYLLVTQSGSSLNPCSELFEQSQHKVGFYDKIAVQCDCVRS